MSKATVQMGLSTTGFGQQVDTGERLVTRNPSAQPRPQRQFQDQNPDGQYFYDTPVYEPHPQQLYFHGSRLSRTLDSIPEQPTGPHPAVPSTDNRFSITNFLSNPVDSSRIGKTQSSSPPQFHRHHEIPSRASSTTPEKRSPKSVTCQLEDPFSPSQFNSQLQATSQRQQQQHHQPTHHYAYTDPFANRTPQPNPHQQQLHSPQAASQAGAPFYVSELDLLNSPSRLYTSDNQVIYTSDEGADIDLSSLPLYSPDSTHGALAGNSALDLGFGVGTAVDFQHDWSENTGFDLFDGLFFGGGG